MDIDNPTLSNISGVVGKAREELSSVISALTELLAAVAVSSKLLRQAKPRDDLTSSKNSDNKAEKVETNGPSAEDNKSKTETHSKRSLKPILDKFETLRKTVEQAVSMHTTYVANSKNEEEAKVTPEERASLTERRNTLIAEVRSRNEKVKLLIDQLRDLHHDIVMLLSSYYKPLSTQPR